MTKNKIVVLGSCNTDMVIKSDKLPVPGETVLGGTFMMNPGGKGANQAVAASRLGGDVTFITKIGDDVFGRQSVDLYKEEKINTDYIFLDPTNPSGIALITVDANGENCIVVASGANKTLTPTDVESVKDVLLEADILLMQLEIPIETVEYAAKIANENGVKVILNPAPAPTQALSDELLKNLHIIIPNKREAEMISSMDVSGWDSAQKAADAISSKGVDIVIITLGSLGALLKEKDRYTRVPAYEVKTVDTTAAGDTFCGALATALSEGKRLEDSIRFANKCSSMTVTKMGAQASIPYRKDIKFNL